MKVRCLVDNGKSLSKRHQHQGSSPNYTREYLEPGKVYNVYGIMLIGNTLHYLIACREANSPHFEPAEFFELVENSVPPSWFYTHFRETDVETNADAIWGYKELALNINHNIELVERTSEAFKVFYIRKNEIDEWTNEQTH